MRLLWLAPLIALIGGAFVFFSERSAMFYVFEIVPLVTFYIAFYRLFTVEAGEHKKIRYVLSMLWSVLVAASPFALAFLMVSH